MALTPIIYQLIDALRYLPGVGPKTAQRMAFHLLEHDREKARQLAYTIQSAMDKVSHCKNCRMFCEADLCQLCANARRDQTSLCIVESPADVIAIEKTGFYKGLYFILHGHISAIDGVGPKAIGMDLLKNRLEQRIIQEMIVATNPTVEGEATSHYISELVKPYQIKITRIARGIPLGGELEYVDSHTITEALNRRSEIVD
ncbi:MAG: recombination protein RecR [Gammaproteobacteria bacterium GWF2_41_13]|nr:MAG: recombination protein RecR [Gammaproteobacteria bacterium GWF2_41_13]